MVLPLFPLSMTCPICKKSLPEPAAGQPVVTTPGTAPAEIIFFYPEVSSRLAGKDQLFPGAAGKKIGIIHPLPQPAEGRAKPHYQKYRTGKPHPSIYGIKKTPAMPESPVVPVSYAGIIQIR